MQTCPQCQTSYEKGTHVCAAAAVGEYIPEPGAERSAAVTDPGEGPPGSEDPSAGQAAPEAQAGPAKPDRLIGATVGSYRIRKLLGQGGMGAVYAAVHPVIGSKVAIKFLHPRYSEEPTIVDRFYNEARAVNIIGHDNVLKILDLNVTPDRRHYFVMEFLDGRALQNLVEPQVPVPLSVAGPILLQVCAALQAAHEKGIIHRDLKPDNIYLISNNGRQNFVKVVDFGIAKLTEGGPTGSRTAAGVVMGTPAYMSPEQASGETDRIDGRSDIYSLGVIMYQLATGQLPFNGTTFAQMLIGHLQEAPPPPRGLAPDLPEDYEQVLLRALGKAQEDRQQSMNELHDSISACMEANGISPELPLADAPVPEGKASGPPTGGPATPPRTAFPRGTNVGSGSARASQLRQTRPPMAPARSRLPLLLGGGVAAAIAIGLLLGVLLRSPRPVGPDAGGGQGRSDGRKGEPKSTTPVDPKSTSPADPKSTTPVEPKSTTPVEPKSTETAAAAAGAAQAAELIKKASRLQQDGDTGAARDLLEQAVQLAPKNAEAHFRLARLFHMTQPQRAKTEYEAAAQLSPEKYGEAARLALGTLQ